MSVEKRFRRRVDPCQHCLTLDDTHDLCVTCLGEEPQAVSDAQKSLHSPITARRSSEEWRP